MTTPGNTSDDGPGTSGRNDTGPNRPDSAPAEDVPPVGGSVDASELDDEGHAPDAPDADQPSDPDDGPQETLKGDG